MLRWFIPDGVSRPAHLPHGGVRVVSGGPSHSGSGLVVGGPWLPLTTGWQPQPAGWWLHPAGAHPRDLLRLDVDEGGTEVPGSDDSHSWLVPSLLRPAAGGLVCARPRRFGPTGFASDPQDEALLQRLRVALQPDAPDLDEADLAALTVDVLARNYHLSAAELAACGWMTDRVAAQILLAAAGMREPT